MPDGQAVGLERAHAGNVNRRATRLLCVGALTLDTIFQLDELPTRPGKFMPRKAVQIAAGMAASAATAAARQGGRVSLWASVGSDGAADTLIEGISAEGVDCRLVRRVPGGASAISSILVGPDGERIIVPYYDPLTQSDPAGLPKADMTEFDAVLVDVRWPGAARRALAAARDAGRPAVLDADVAPQQTLEALLPLATHIVASEPAAAIVCGAIAVEERVAQLANRFGCFVAVTDGAKGTWWAGDADDDVRHVPAPPVNAVDTLAAGDIFHGTFALAVAGGVPPALALQRASAAAALKCQRFGGRLGAPTAEEVDAMVTWYYA